MTKLALGFLGPAILLFAALQTSLAGAAILYHFVDLGTLGGTYSCAYAINDSGQIVGTATLPGDSVSNPFLYSAGTMTDLGNLGAGSRFGVAYGINNVGQVVGQSALAGNTADHGFLYSNGVLTDLGAMGGTGSSATSINDSGEIVGMTGTLSVFRPFVYTGGVMTVLGTLGGATGIAAAINDAGEIAGSAETSNGMNNAFLYSNGVMTNLDTIVGQPSFAFGINSSGQVVGENSSEHAFLYSNGSAIDLGTLTGEFSSANGINDIGEVVGFFETNHVNRAFVYEDGVATDLNSVMDSAGDGWTLQEAYGINDNGWIVGGAINSSGQTNAYLLVPVPEPPGIVLGLLALCGMGLYVVRKRSEQVGGR